MTKEIRRLSMVLLAMFLALFAATSWIQAVDADNLAQYSGNTRTRLDSYETQRGSILVEGAPIASSTPSADDYKFQRVYTDPFLWSTVTGYYNPVLQSSTGIENAMNADLSGVTSNALFGEIDRIVSGQPASGDSVELTLNSAGQRAAMEALDGLTGAVIALEPDTGRILVMASTPGFDPNTMSVHDGALAESTFAGLEADPADPLYNRAIAGDLNPPGSTFKILVAAAAFESGDYTADSELPNPARYTLPGTNTTIYNASRGTCGPGENTTIAEAIRLSCNIPMAQLAVKLGDDAILAMAEKFGFNTSFETPLPSTASTYPTKSLSKDTLAQTGYGQGDGLRATPLQIAMISAGIANDGIVMNPRLVDEVIGTDLSVVRAYENSEFGRAISADTADEVTKAMVESVATGAARNARIEGIDVAGKTGTAENGPGDPYTLWFTGFAPADDPQIAVAVVVEDGGGKGQSGTGDTIAAPIAKKVIEAVLNR